MCAINQLLRFVVGAMLAAFVMAGVVMSAASAQQSGTPTAAGFLANPGQLLQQNPNGGSLLANSVQQLAVSDPSTFKALIGLVANASDQQKSAIAQGLTRAAKVEVLTNQTLAQDWESQIAAITDPTFKTAALDALGDVKLGAIGGAAGGAAGAGLGGPGGGPGGGGAGQTIGSTGGPVTTPSFTFTGSTSGATAVPTSGTTTGTTTRTTTGTPISNAVSVSQ